MTRESRGVVPGLLALACLVIVASAQADEITLSKEASDWLGGKPLRILVYTKVNMTETE